MVVFSVRLVFWDAPEHRHEPPTSQRSHSAVAARGPFSEVVRSQRAVLHAPPGQAPEGGKAVKTPRGTRHHRSRTTVFGAHGLFSRFDHIDKLIADRVIMVIRRVFD